MTHEIVSVLCGGQGLKLAGNETDFYIRYIDNLDNQRSPCECYQDALDHCPFEALILIHDDVSIHDPEWLQRVLELFRNPECVAVGLGGATGLGNRELYRKPFNIWNMARTGYASNQTDAETHGTRFDGVRRVAVFDAFFLACRVDFLRSLRGWPMDHLTHHCLDLWLACEAARAGKETWMVGVNCTHHGGGSSVSDKYAKAKWLQGGTMELDHILPHKWIYEEYRDVLPIII